MKKFVKKLCLFIVLISLICVAANAVFLKLYQADTMNTDKFKTIKPDLQICSFGSSHDLYSFNYEKYENDYNCFNFGLTAQRLSYDYRLFLEYGDNITEGTVVFLTISYCTVFGGKEELEESFESKNKRYYLILPPSLIKAYDFKTDFFVHYFPILVQEPSIIVKTFLGKEKEGKAKAYWDRSSSREASELDAHAKYLSQIANIELDENGNRIVDEESIEGLYDLIDGIRSKGAVPILITTPLMQEYFDEIEQNNREDFYADFYSLVDRIVSDTGIDYYDYSADERFLDRYDLFIDSDHLNRVGGAEFTDIIMEEIVYNNRLIEPSLNSD